MRIELTPKEAEAILWGIAEIGDEPERPVRGPLDPLYLLIVVGYARDEIAAGCLLLEDGIEEDARFITEPLSALQKDILRLCVENSSWLTSYDRAGLSAAMRNEAHESLRTLAYKLEELGVEVNHMPTKPS